MTTRMKRTVLPVLIMALGLGPAGFAATPFEEESFSIVLPDGFGEFAKNEQKEAKVTTFVSKGQNGDVVIVSYALMAPTEDLDEFLASERDSLLKSLNARLDSQREIEVDGKQALSIRYSLQGAREMFGRTDLVIANPRMYQVIYLGGTPDGPNDAKTEQMFSSFNVDEEVLAKIEQDALDANGSDAKVARKSENDQ
ncbi:MAG TPA: hypothetical protein VMS56_14030 [Thermoanaerobaculia bacterium]|nr:hypothetical protein [Thermoanaerobaculia bacterium]